MAQTETGIVLPFGVDVPPPAGAQRGMIVNETDLPDSVVAEAVESYFEENASVLGVSSSSTFQSYSNQGGGLLARPKYRTPGNVIEEIILARDLAERDDDVGSTIGSMIATAFADGMQNTHRDETTVALFDEVARHADIDSVCADLYRELMIAGSFTTATVFTRESFQFQPEGADRQRTRGLVAPLVGVLPAEQIRVIDNDMFGTGTLAYKPISGDQERWLAEFFDSKTTAGRKAEMRRQDPVLTAMLLERLQFPDDLNVTFQSEFSQHATGQALYRLNPRMVARSTLPKGAWRYPRPLLTRNFALLEAKRLLNIMDFALLSGGANFLVVAKKGSDQRPAMQAEVDSLREQIKRASRSGVLIGDHRLDIEIITPNLAELLNPAKRKMLGRKLAMALLRVPESGVDDPGGEGQKAEVEFIQKVISLDRRKIRRHLERYVYRETAKRNTRSFEQGAAAIWFPKIILQGTNYFTDYILKMRDRGDIPRRYAVEAGGFDYDASLQQRKREKANGDDRVMTPAAVPFSSPAAGPQDNQPGRPPGTSPANGKPGSPAPAGPSVRPRQLITRNRGETVTAMYEEGTGSWRIGELTAALMAEYGDTAKIGRITTFEQHALEVLHASEHDVVCEGPVTAVLVNPDDELVGLKALRLADGLSMILGERADDGAILARALTFREPVYDQVGALEAAMRFGYEFDDPAKQLTA